MNAKQEKQFKSLVEFLGKVLGPDYEITLHNLTNKQSSLVAIANGHISGREVGAPSTGFVKRMLATKLYETNEYLLSYRGRAVNNKILRSSSFFIKNEAQKPVGMLCISFDDSRYRELSMKLLTLCHPASYLERNALPTEPPSPDDQIHEALSNEAFYDDIEASLEVTFTDVERRCGADLEHLTHKERVEIVAQLERRGFFLMKDSIPYVAEKLQCSTASIYRYIKNAKSCVNQTEQ